MAAATGGNQEVLDLLKTMGFDPRRVRRFSITFEPDDAVMVYVTMYADVGDLKTLNTVIKHYKLVEIEDEADNG
jgi:hypothetical protein